MLNDPEGIDPPEEPFVYQELLHQGSVAVKQALAMAETTPDSTPHDMRRTS